MFHDVIRNGVRGMIMTREAFENACYGRPRIPGESEKGFVDYFVTDQQTRITTRIRRTLDTAELMPDGTYFVTFSESAKTAHADYWRDELDGPQEKSGPCEFNPIHMEGGMFHCPYCACLLIGGEPHS